MGYRYDRRSSRYETDPIPTAIVPGRPHERSVSDHEILLDVMTLSEAVTALSKLVHRKGTKGEVLRALDTVARAHKKMVSDVGWWNEKRSSRRRSKP